MADTTQLSDTLKRMIPKDIVKFDCSNRPIKFLPLHFFAEFQYLTDIILTDTLISKLPSNAFTGLSNLRFLDLSNSPVKIIEEGSFDYLKKLKELWLPGITMKRIQPALVDGLPELEFLVRPDGIKEYRGARNDFTTAAGMFQALSSHVIFSLTI